MASPPVVGMVGGGQLARMTAQAAVSLGIEFRVLADTPADSAAQVCALTSIGDFRSADDVLTFGAGCDVVTFDHEHVPAAHLTALEDLAAVRPGGPALRFAQDKRAMRDRLSASEAVRALGVRCPRYQPVSSPAEVAAFARPGRDGCTGEGWPVVLKATSGGYDGRGVWVCADEAAAAEVIGHGVGLIAEEFVPFERELAVLVARSPKGQGAAYPVVQTVQADGICREVIAPAPGLDPDLAVTAQRLGLTIAAELGVTGLLAVELFECGGALLINELAMRPHNCGHWTIDGAGTSQFEQHLRAVLDLPLGDPTAMRPAAVMVNVLGGEHPDLYGRLVHVMAADPGVNVHLYGKAVRPGRKVGHVTVTGDDVPALRDRAWRAANYLSHGTEDEGGSPLGGRPEGQQQRMGGVSAL
ncbi:MAG TPA: 5-(carboxyamino)imidazole ribonucleotide synthase [Streptosporangiaceae bacterium]